MLRQLPHAGEMSEFISGLNGDCGETAELIALHTLDPNKWPLTATALLDIVHRTQGRSQASANGAEPIGSIANDLAGLGVACTNYGYAEPLTNNVNWQAVLDQWGGLKPIIFEWAKAGNLPGDESGVAYHFSTCLAWDPVTQSGLFGDGDNAAAYQNNRLAPYTLANLVAAQPCALIVIEAAIGGPIMLDLTNATAANFYTDLGNDVWHCKQTNQTLGHGILDFYRSLPASGSLNGLTALGLPVSSETSILGAPAGSGVVAQRFERGVLVYDPARQYDNPPGASGGCYLMHLDVAPFAPVIPPAPPAPPAPPPVIQVVPDPAVQAALDAADKKLGDLKTALTAVLSA